MKANDIASYLSDAFTYRRRSSADWLLPVSVGLGLGVAVGFLIAPMSGEETRRRLRDSAERVKDRAMSAAQRGQEQLQESAGSTSTERAFAGDLNIR